LCKQYTREDESSLSKKINKDKFRSKILDAENNEKVAIMELYSQDLRLKQEHK